MTIIQLAFGGANGSTVSVPVVADVSQWKIFVGKFRGYALFVYKAVEAAQAALVESVKSIDGCTLQCKLAIEGIKGRHGAAALGARERSRGAVPGMCVLRPSSPLRVYPFSQLKKKGGRIEQLDRAVLIS